MFVVCFGFVEVVIEGRFFGDIGLVIFGMMRKRILLKLSVLFSVFIIGFLSKSWVVLGNTGGFRVLGLEDDCRLEFVEGFYGEALGKLFSVVR